MSTSGSFIGNRYRLLRLIGEGGMGRVFTAVDEEYGCRVAIKMLRSDRIESKFIERFHREIALIRSLGHENLCEILDVGSCSNGAPFFVMPLLKGTTLCARLTQGPLCYESALDISLQLLDGLQAVHSKNIIHRDLKSKNVFLVTDHPHFRYFVKILDFGISKIMDSADSSLTDTGTVIGSLKYMAPEQVSSLGHIDVRADVYVAGVLLYEMFTGIHPMCILSLSENNPITYRQCKPLRSIVPSMSIFLEQVIMTAMSYDPDDRFRDALEMRGALIDALKADEAFKAACKLDESLDPVVKETAIRIRKPRTIL